ncbi:MAG: MgtC/SapB family protein [Planctomycetia bacterium]|uniref:MgtC/SapB/SrpB/YhiD N-terminal domain-containing protein n=1 Tax=Candidatus Brocadia sapporoensis TaxID=392547 RepID=A0A1V6M1Z7_9BACT|nr:MgtC/SapB family protein [Candidatus Brocadia sapporoensis]MCC7238845.1 MgtC/SapB family protein [Candidatus Brocadia sp.]QOJ07614.1 MAG: MgtC/SapB family protein [Planctomycetia bacterium]TVL96737.1 MAG: hypothetical protein CV082_06035 [Candidatus Brocadia sp. BL1]MDG6006105.1 MgtC/SapB family protein [Candidatus Brocadia sp.]OQD46395.1 hypothetical protein BIY37_03465 [Candidatus Brocadia sapporoensis]
MVYLFSIFESFDGAIGKLLLSAVLGGIVGWERERRGRPAGLRTHVLVCIGATLMMVVSEHIFERYKTFDTNSVIRVDPARIAAQVVTGIGFLGAGTILRFKTAIRGLTTAASLWVIAGIGLAVGSDCYVPAILTTTITLFALLLGSLFERHIKRDTYRTLKICVSNSEPDFTSLMEILKRNSVELQHYEFERDLIKNEVLYNINVKFKDEALVSKVCDEVTRSIKEISKFGWE